MGQATEGGRGRRILPAAKAPAVSLKPRRWVSSDAPVTVSRHSATNVSSLRDSATTCARELPLSD